MRTPLVCFFFLPHCFPTASALLPLTLFAGKDAPKVTKISAAEYQAGKRKATLMYLGIAEGESKISPEAALEEGYYLSCCSDLIRIFSDL